MRAKKEAAKTVTADLELDSLFDPKPAAAPPPAKPPATTKPTPTFTPSAPQPKPAAPFVPSPPKPAAATPPPAAKPAPAQATAAPPPAAEAAPPAPAPAAATPLPRPAPSPPSRDGLDDQKVREIYARYVGAKRAANESTAGITFDKLATSLRAQADKLKSSHPTKNVDFEVVVKDGKTALRPIPILK